MAACSDLLPTGAFPDVGFSWLAWIGIVPLLAAISQPLVARESGLSFLAGMTQLPHTLSIRVPLCPMRTYGRLPWPVACHSGPYWRPAWPCFLRAFTAPLSAACGHDRYSPLFLAPTFGGLRISSVVFPERELSVRMVDTPSTRNCISFQISISLGAVRCFF